MSKLSALEKWNLLMSLASASVSEEVQELIQSTVVDNFSSDPFNSSPDDLLGYLEMTLGLEGGHGDDQGDIIGPYQFGRLAWKEAGEGQWRVNAMDPYLSAEAAAKYYLINKRRFELRYPGREYTNAIGYLYHNQGPTGAAHFLDTGTLKFPGQSIAARRLFSTIEI